MVEAKKEISDDFNKAIIKEIENIKRRCEAKQDSLTEDYIELHKKIKAKSAVVAREQNEIANIFKAFVKKHEASRRAVFVKTIDFYLDSLKEFDFRKILAALEEEIQVLKREAQESQKIEVDRMKYF